MTRVHFIRHGQTDWNLEGRIQGQSESRLTELGRKQALNLCKRLDSITFDSVYSSSSIRAYDTAQILINNRSVEIRKLDSLREIELGAWEGRLKDDVKESEPEEYYSFYNDPSQFNFFGMETFYELQKRALSTFEWVVKNDRGKEILIVGHGAWIKALLSYFENRPMKDLWKPPAMSNCSHSIVAEVNAGQYEIAMYSGLTEW
ncbi:histidine phosphatase family protein [Thermodesulfobacteriota bacterium]